MKTRADPADRDAQRREPVSLQDTKGPLGPAATGPRQSNQGERIAQLRQSSPAASGNGLPESLRSGIETLSGVDLSGVRVHRNSSRPAALQAHAYAQGQDIHLAPGQDGQLPHEAWHIVQQAQGRVAPTLRTPEGVPVNDDPGLEREADRMGSHALVAGRHKATKAGSAPARAVGRGTTLQGAWHWNAHDAWWEEDEGFVYVPQNGTWHMDQDVQPNEQPEFDAHAIENFKQALLNTMNTAQVEAYFAIHPNEVGRMRGYLTRQVAARPGNADITRKRDNKELFDENDLDEGEINAAFTAVGRAVPVSTTTEEGESVNSAGASTCVIVFLRAETTQDHALIGAAHLNANDLASTANVRQALVGLQAEVNSQLDVGSGEAIDTAHTYSIGGQDSDRPQDLLDYVRLALVLKEFNAQMEWRGAVMPATAKDSGAHVDARMDSTSLEYSVQTKAVRAPSAAVPTMQLGRDKRGLASGKADRRAEQQRQRDRGRHETRRQELPAFDPGAIGHAPTGDVGVMLTMLMILGQVRGTGAQPLLGPGPQQRALPSSAPQTEVPRNSTALTSMAPMGPLPFNTSTPHTQGGFGANSTALTPLPQARQPEPSVRGQRNTTSVRPWVAPDSAPRNTTSPARNVNATALPPQPTLERPVRPPPAETSVDKSGKLTFATDALRKQYDAGKGKGGLEGVAINNLLSSTKTGAGIQKELEAQKVKNTILRLDLGAGVGGEADLSGGEFISVNSQQDLRKNTVVAAHEFRHREQFASGILDKTSNPYRKAYAEIEAKNVELDTHAELKGRGYFDTLPVHSQLDEIDLEARTADPAAYDRSVFRRYLDRYRGGDAAKYPDFQNDTVLDAHIADQKAYFEARRHLSSVELEIRRRGLSPDGTHNLPQELKDQLFDARAENKKAKKAAEKSQPKP